MEQLSNSAQFLGIAAACGFLIALSIPIMLARINARLKHQNILLKNMIGVLDPDRSKWREYKTQQRARIEAHKNK